MSADTHLISGQKVKVTGSQSAKTCFRRSSGRREFALYRVARQVPVLKQIYHNGNVHAMHV